MRQWDADHWALFQASAATTGDAPLDGTPWAEVTTPIVMWGPADPNTDGESDPNGPGIGAPERSVFLSQHVDGVSPLCFSIHGNDGHIIVSGGDSGSWLTRSAYTANAHVVDITTDASVAATNDAAAGHSGGAITTVFAYQGGEGDGDARGWSQAQRDGVGDGNASLDHYAIRSGSGSGFASAVNESDILDSATGTATAGGRATHYAGGEAHVLPTANADGAFNDVKADMVFTDNTEGPVIHDQSDGHTYRIICTAGVLSTVLVT